ncbi:MAG: flavin monoamine oxidase family protein [Marivita sp.]|uniref:flavin monoamine oxidase family protein n=1 Tax=Marivita sp. TaxID=2003365 RepID=UPI003EF3C9E8
MAAHAPVAIVGGGLTGLAVAQHLHAAGVPFRLFDARDRLGGRIRTEHLGTDGFDLGPSWFWPGQPRMAALVQALGLEVFEQYATGALLYETEQGGVIRDRGMSSMQGSLRVKGGMGAIVSGLAAGLPKGSPETGRTVVSVSDAGVLGFADGGSFEADKIVLAMPPRIVAGLGFVPVLTSEVDAALRDIPTWMAGHAKCVAVYDVPFWRHDGLSGDVMSRRGPMVEIHDASAGDRGALFGFLGVPVAQRAGQGDTVAQACVAQLTHLFGPEAAKPVAVFYTDWAEELHTAVPRDQDPLTHHPAYGRPVSLRAPLGARIFLASTELAPEMGGFLEGALAAADEAARWVLAR